MSVVMLAAFEVSPVARARKVVACAQAVPRAGPPAPRSGRVANDAVGFAANATTTRDLRRRFMGKSPADPPRQNRPLSMDLWSCRPSGAFRFLLARPQGLPRPRAPDRTNHR